MNADRKHFAAAATNGGIKKTAPAIKSSYYFGFRLLVHFITCAKSVYPDLLSSPFIDVGLVLDPVLTSNLQFGIGSIRQVIAPDAFLQNCFHLFNLCIAKRGGAYPIFFRLGQRFVIIK